MRENAENAVRCGRYSIDVNRIRYLSEKEATLVHKVQHKMTLPGAIF